MIWSRTWLLGLWFMLAQCLHAQPKVVAYVPNWIELAAFAETIDYAKLTHNNVAFENSTARWGDDLVSQFRRQRGGFSSFRHPRGIEMNAIRAIQTVAPALALHFIIVEMKGI